MSNFARSQNESALHSEREKDIGLAELDGFQLPVDVTREYLSRMQKESRLLSMADEMVLPRLEMEVPKLGVPQLSGGVRNEEGARTDGSDMESGEVKFNVTDQNYYILFEPKRDAIKNTHYSEDEWGNLILDEFIERWANDVGLIGCRASAASGNLAEFAGRTDLDDRFNGWIAVAEGADTESTRIGLEDTDGAENNTMPELNWTDGAGDPKPIDTEMFNDGIIQLDSRYRNPDNAVWITSPNQVQAYHHNLTGREDGLGVAVLQGNNDVTPFEYDVIGLPEWPDEYAMLTDPDNLAFGLYQNMELDQTTDTDKVHENRLHSRNWLEGQFDFQIKEMQAGVLVTDLDSPLSA